MNAFYLISIIIGLAAQNAFKKGFSKKNSGRGVYTFSFMTCSAALLFYLLTAGNLQWNPGLIVYAVFFALSFGTATIFSTLAVSCGPLSLSALISSFSLMIPTFYGLIFLKESVSMGLIPGLILLSLSLILVNKRSPGSAVSIKWLVYVFIAFLGNGMCSVVQKMQQNAFAGGYKNEFMILSMCLVVLCVGIAALLTERKYMGHFLKSGWYLALGCGVMNGMVNIFVMILSGLMSVSLMFPLVSVGGIAVTFLISKLVYKESLSKAQYIGFILGIAAVVFLNL